MIQSINVIKASLGFFLYFSIYTVNLFAAKVDIIHVPSASMKKSYEALLVLPDSHISSDEHYPVLYLLHGHSGHYTGWLEIAKQLRDWADNYKMIIVCPDGDHDSWYIDSPIRKNRKFETFLSCELISYMDSNYKTIKKNSARGISGVSMGGHGAILLSLKHPDIFEIAGSSSGALDILPFYNHWNLEHNLGSFNTYKEQWKNYSCLYVLDKLFPKKSTSIPSIPQLWIDCGTEDFFLDVNRKFHRKLVEKKIAHKYLEKPGGHTLEYWKDSYQKQILFFVEKFKR